MPTYFIRDFYRKDIQEMIDIEAVDFLYRTSAQANIHNAFEKKEIPKYEYRLYSIKSVLYIRPDFVVDRDKRRLIVASGKKRATRKHIIAHNLQHAKKREILNWKFTKGSNRGININFRAQKIVKLKESVFLLANSGCKMYHHWMFDVLPMTYYAKDIENVKFLVNNPDVKFKAESLKLLGKSNILPIKASKAMLIDKLTLVHSTSDVNYLDFEAIQWLVKQLKAAVTGLENKKLPKKILISRHGLDHPRELINGEQVIKYFLDKGFTNIDCGQLSFADQIRYFNNAEEVIFEHGSAGANCIFCKEGTLVLHLQPDKVNGFNQHAMASKYFGHTVGIVFGSSNNKIVNEIKPHNIPWKVDMEKIKEAYEKLLDIRQLSK